MNTHSEIRALTGIRAFAAYGVLLAHFQEELFALIPQFSVFEPISSRGGLGVDLFFILSGFILAHIYGRRFLEDGKKSYGPYLLNRFARIYPSYFATLTLLVVMVGAGKLLGSSIGGDYSWIWLPAHYLMLQPLPGVPGGWNYPGWSIGAEFFAYALVFPVAITGYRRFRVGGVAALILSLVCILIFWVPKTFEWWGRSEHLPMVASEFLAGMLLCFSVKSSDVVRLWLARLLPVTIFIIGMLLGSSMSWTHGWDRLTTVLFFVPLIGGLFSSRGMIASVLSLSPIVYLGHTSYALYLVHAIVQKVLKVSVFEIGLHSESILVRSLVFFSYLIAPLAMASVVYHFIEVPSRWWIRQKCLPPEPDNSKFESRAVHI